MIADIALIVKEVISQLRKKGAVPFIIPAMGSHGGATAEGQIMVLKHYGITEESMGVPIRKSMDVVKPTEANSLSAPFQEQMRKVIFCLTNFPNIDILLYILQTNTIKGPL